MNNKTIGVLHPEYYTKFQCIGGECEENCCTGGWNIFVDKKSYQKMRNIRDPEFQKKVSRCTKRVRGESASDASYASMFLENGNCPFLTPDAFCEIQTTYGADYLCRTCRTYPRLHTSNVEGRSELSLTMSCPEAARLALLSGEPVRFQISEFDRQNAILGMSNFSLKADTKTEAFAPYLWKIREACIDILQYKGTTMNNRLLALGMMLDKLEKTGGEDAAETAAFYAGAVLAGEFDGITDKFQQNDELRANMEAVLYMSVIAFSKSNKEFRQLLEAFLSIGEVEETDGETKRTVLIKTLFEHLDQCVKKHWGPFLERYSQGLENYFVNYIFSTVFPFRFQAELTLYEHFIVLAEQYAMLQMLLCGLAGEEGITKENFVRTISVFSRFSQHGNNTLHAVNLYKEKELASLAHISFLLRR